MANTSPENARQGAAATTVTATAAAKTSVPAAKASAKRTPKPAAKPAVKAPGKAAAKPARKPAAARGTAKKDATAKADKNAKPKKAKLVRDSFTMPEAEYELMAAVKKRCIAKGLAVKKSEVLRAAIVALAAQSDASVMKALRGLMVIKTGRPPKGQK